MSRVSPSTSDAPGLLFKTASKILPKIILVNITPDATLYRSGNRRLTEVIHILDINRNRLSKDEMRLHTAQFSEMNDTAKDIESQFKRIPVDGQPLLSKKDLRNLVATFFLQAVALHDDVVKTSRDAIFRSLPKYSVESLRDLATAAAARDGNPVVVFLTDSRLDNDSNEDTSHPIILDTRNLSTEDIFNTMNIWDLALRTRGILDNTDPSSPQVPSGGNSESS